MPVQTQEQRAEREGTMLGERQIAQQRVFAKAAQAMHEKDPQRYPTIQAALMELRGQTAEPQRPISVQPEETLVDPTTLKPVYTAPPRKGTEKPPERFGQDNESWSLTLFDKNFIDLTPVERRQVMEAQTKATEDISGLVQATIDNPILWKTLPAPVKEKLALPLAQRKFDFVAAEAGAAAGLTPSMQAGVKRLKSSLEMLQTLDKDLTQETGLAGRMAGSSQRFWAWLTQSDTPASLYQGVADSLLPALARTSGEVGNLAELEQARYQSLAPQVSDAANIRRAKYAAIQYIIDAAEKGKTAEEMSPFLDYMKFVETGKFSVTVQGQTFDFDSQAKLDEFKRRAGIP
jgi:hypothetical protein